jgi:TolB-like protein
MPFQNLSGDETEDYLADSITDDLTTDLSRIAEVLMIARESAYAYQGKAMDGRTVVLPI